MTVTLSMGTVSQRIASADLAADPLTAATGGSSASSLAATADAIPKTQVPVGTFAAPVSEAEKTTAAPATIVGGDTPGDQIIAGLNKRWAQFDRAIKSANAPALTGGDEPYVGSSLAAPGDGRSADRAATSPPHCWSSTLDEDGDSAAIDQDAMINGMSDGAGFVDKGAVEASIKQMKAMDGGGALAAELSSVARGIETSVKTLVTGQ